MSSPPLKGYHRYYARRSVVALDHGRGDEVLRQAVPSGPSAAGEPESRQVRGAKNGMVGELSQGLIDAMVENFVLSEAVFLGTHTAGAAVARVVETDTAWPHRNVATMLVMDSAWTDPGDDDRLRDATRRLFSSVEPFTGGYYDNIDSDGEDVGGNYGPVYNRLSRPSPRSELPDSSGGRSG